LQQAGDYATPHFHHIRDGTDCGVIHDRDHNAAINLMNMAGSSSVTACGAIRSGAGREAKTKRIAVKQEPTHGIFVHA
jgi:transposase